jgi:hypothetical protein
MECLTDIQTDRFNIGEKLRHTAYNVLRQAAEGNIVDRAGQRGGPPGQLPGTPKYTRR